METPDYTKYIIRLSAGISTKESVYQIPKILDVIKIPLLGKVGLGGTMDLVKSTGTVLVAELRSQYKNEYDELVLIYMFTGVEQD